MIGLDVHVLVHPTTPRAWVWQSIASVRRAQLAAGFPVYVHVLPAVLGHVGKARAAGYAKGSQPYVTSVDDDDWIEPDAFAALAAVLADDPACVTAGGTMHMENINGDRAERRSDHAMLRVFRRDVVASAPLFAWRVSDGPRLIAHAETLGAQCTLAQPLYHYRLHRSPHSALLGRYGAMAA